MSSTAVSSLFGTGGDSINVLEEYSGIAWKCIDIRASTLSDQDLFVQRKVGDKWQADPNHDFNRILEGGDSQLDLSEILEAHEKSMCLYGEAFWYFSKGETSAKPFAIYLLDPSAMTVMVSDLRVTGYVYQKDNHRTTFDTDEIMHIKTYDWRHPFRGTGPMQSAGWYIRSARYTITYVNNFLENNAIPAGVIVAKGQVDDADWKLFKEQWAAKYSGIDNMGKTGFVRGSELDFVKTGMSLGEVDFDKIKKSDREDIMVMFGISKPMMAIFDDINRASATVARQLFAISLTSPALKKVQRKLSKKVAEWYGPNFQLGATNPIPEDEEATLNKYDKGVGRWLTVNEARAHYGLEPKPGGDEINPTVGPPATPKALSIKVKKVGKGEFSYEMKESFRSQTEDLQVKYEQEFWQATNPILRKQKEQVLDQLKPKKLVDARFDADKEAAKLAESTLQVLIQLANAQGLLAAQFVGNDQSSFELTPVTEKYLRDSIASSTLSFTKETQDKIAQALIDGLNEGESMGKIGKRIESIYDEVLMPKNRKENEAWRIERLARTEVIKTSNEMTEVAYKQSGVVQKKEWFANPGRCEFCAALDGSVIQLGGTFIPLGSTLDGVDGGTRVNGYENIKHSPLHPACRCTLIPVIED